MEQAKTLTLDGQSYEIDQFSQGVQQAVFIYNKFSAQLQEQQLEVMKTQAALQQVGQQITDAVKAELAAKESEEQEQPAAEAAAA
jgi:hypothetical protein